MIITMMTIMNSAMGGGLAVSACPLLLLRVPVATGGWERVACCAMCVCCEAQDIFTRLITP